MTEEKTKDVAVERSGKDYKRKEKHVINVDFDTMVLPLRVFVALAAQVMRFLNVAEYRSAHVMNTITNGQDMWTIVRNLESTMVVVCHKNYYEAVGAATQARRLEMEAAQHIATARAWERLVDEHRGHVKSIKAAGQNPHAEEIELDITIKKFEELDKIVKDIEKEIAAAYAVVDSATSYMGKITLEEFASRFDTFDMQVAAIKLDEELPPI